MQKLSVCLTTFNSEDTIRPCVESVLWADEIIVFDSCSTDSTREFLAENPIKVVEQPWLGYAAQKQLSLDMAQHDWCVPARQRRSAFDRAATKCSRHSGRRARC